MASSSGEYLHDRPRIAITALNEVQKHNWGKFLIIPSTAQTTQDLFHSHLKLEMVIADGFKLSMEVAATAARKDDAQNFLASSFLAAYLKLLKEYETLRLLQ